MLTAVLAVTLLAGCAQAQVGAGSEADDPDVESSGDASGGSVPAPTSADLVLTISSPAAGQGPVTLMCDFASGTASGDHAEPDQACEDLLGALDDGDPFVPVPADAMCTQIFGGEAVVDVSGTLTDTSGATQDVQAQFALNNGCEIERWERLGAVLGPYRGSA